ncbi:MAG TPA: ATP-binding protein [Candidatus Eisenbacteria bacterium]|nr:ATP-binding protein [Candidatus Eisenbacteria bacterium]
MDSPQEKEAPGSTPAPSRRRVRERPLDFGRSFWLVQLALLFSIVAPVILVAVIGYRWTERRLTEETLVRRQAIAYAAAASLRGRFDRYTSIVSAFASNDVLRDTAAEGKREEVGKMLRNITEDFPAFDRAFLTDPRGVVASDTTVDPEAAGADLSFQDWYFGVGKEWKPYVSEIYRRPAKPQANVFAVAVPVKDASGAVIAILVTEIRTDVLLLWTKDIEVGPSGFAYFVDKRGHIAAHPKYPPQGTLVNLSDVPAVQQLRQGRSGVEVVPDEAEKEGMIVAYEPVPEYGWGVVVSQPAKDAFAPRSEYLGLILMVFGAILVVNLLLALGIIRMMRLANEAYLREKAILEGAGDGVVATDAKGLIVKMNPQAEKMLGWACEEICGRPFIDTVPMQDENGMPVPLTFRPLLYALKVGQKKATTTTPTNYYVRKDGTRFPVAVNVTPLKKEETVTGAVELIRDITVEKEIDRAKTEFVSLASHQLLTPLSAVKGYSQLLYGSELGKLKSEQKRVVGNVLQLLERMISLVDTLLNVSRIELGTFSVTPEPTNVAGLVDGVIPELMGQIDEKGVKLLKLYDIDLPIVPADPNLLRIVFQNLLSNAVRYSPNGGKVNLSIERRPTMLLVTVTDEGIGIPHDQQAKIFTKFFRADNARQAVAAGNGMGLYVTKAILESTGGRIWFTSEEGKGTKFYVTLPIEGMSKREGTRSLTYSE